MSSFPTSGPVTARLRFHAGTVEVDATEDGRAIATVEALDPGDERSAEAARAARIACADGRRTVDVPGKGRWRGGVKVRIRLALPPQSTVHSDSGEVRLHTGGVLQGLRVRTGSGDLQVGDVRDLDVKAGDATVVVTGAPQQVHVTTGNGQLTAGSVGDVMFKSGNGKAVLGRTSGAVFVKGGHVGLELGAAERGEVVFQTGAGSAHVGVATGTSVQLDLQSSLGDVRCDLDLEDTAPQGGSDLTVKLVTGIGDLVVARAS
jgi:hypothetical protein